MKYRIISLCPSTTLTLYDLGLGDCVVGRTRYCANNLNRNNNIPALGGTKNPKWDAIASLSPTHILFNMEENDYTHLPRAQTICETIVHTPVNIQESRQLVLDLGETFEASEKAAAIAQDIDQSLAELNKSAFCNSDFTFLYFIWHTPRQMVAGTGTYIEAMLNAAGGRNLARNISNERYPVVPETFHQVADICLLSTEPYPFKEKHIPEYQRFGKQTRIIDGEQISWHGSKTADGLRYLCNFFQDSQHKNNDASCR